MQPNSLSERILATLAVMEALAHQLAAASMVSAWPDSRPLEAAATAWCEAVERERAR